MYKIVMLLFFKFSIRVYSYNNYINVQCNSIKFI